MIVEWFVDFIMGVVTWLLDWLPEADAIAVPDLTPLYGAMRAFDVVVPIQPWFDVLIVIGVVLSIAFLFAVIRQVWKFVPFIGGG